MKTAIIIPNWNSLDFIAECLKSLEKQTLKHHVIVVDNGSVDGSMELIRDKFPHIELMAFPNNAGFAGGVNRGIKPALEQGFDYIALFNNDAAAEPEWLENLVKTMETDSKLGIVTSKIRHLHDQRLDSTGDFYSTWAFPFPRGRDEVDHGQYDGEDNRIIFAGSGGASLYRVEMLKEIGIFDERFFAYFEDVDISFRAQLAGWHVRYEPAAVVRHFVGGTSSRMKRDGKTALKQPTNASVSERPSAFARYHSVKNFHYIYTKNMPGWLYWKYLPRFWASWSLMVISDIRRGLLVTNLKANGAALLHFPGILASRRRIQSRRKVSLHYIDSMLYHGMPPLQMKRFERFGRLFKRK